jgi:hypothetical protein
MKRMLLIYSEGLQTGKTLSGGNFRAKLLIALIVLFVLPLALFAQMGREPAYTILLTPMTAESAIQDDINSLYPSLQSELSWQGQLNSLFRLVETRGQLGRPPSLSNFPMADQELNPRYVVTSNLYIDGSERILTLNLYNTESFELVGTQELAYQAVDEALGMMAFFAWSLSSTLPPDDRVMEPEIVYVNPEDDIDWKNKWLNVGLQAGGSFRWYTYTGASEIKVDNVLITFEAGLRLELQFAHFMVNNNYFSFSFESGADISQEQLKWSDYKETGNQVEPLNVSEANGNGFSMLFPGLLKFNYKPGNFSTSLFGGAYFILPFDDSEYSPPLGIMGGFSAGVRLGPGMLYMDFHYGHDLGSKGFSYRTKENGVERPNPTYIEYARQMFTLVVGYKFGFFDRPDWRNRDQD